MSFTKFDVFSIVAMATAIILMNFIFPAMGLAGDEVNSTDVPKFNITTNEFNYVQQPSEPKPLAPTEGTLNHSSNQFDNYAGSIQYELGENSDGNRTFLVVNPENTTYITDVENNSIDATHTYTSNGEETDLDAKGFKIDLISRDIDKGVYEYVIAERPTDTGFFSGVKNGLEPWIAWIGGIWHTITDIIIDGSLNTGNAIFQFFKFWIDTFHWLITTYFQIVNSVPSNWVKTILSIPGLWLSFEFLKGIYIGIKLIPFI